MAEFYCFKKNGYKIKKTTLLIVDYQPDNATTLFYVTTCLAITLQLNTGKITPEKQAQLSWFSLNVTGIFVLSKQQTLIGHRTMKTGNQQATFCAC